jgi:hypothetical protein
MAVVYTIETSEVGEKFPSDGRESVRELSKTGGDVA